jgi:hypothetical protein
MPPSRAFPLLLASLLAACADRAEPIATQPATIVSAAWTPEQVRPLADQTLKLHLPSESGALTPAEEAAAKELLAAGERLHRLYLDQLHPQALAAQAALSANPERSDLAELFRVMQGPIATTLENERVPFLGVDPETPARNVYPPQVTREALDALMAAHPGRRAELMDPRAVVREAAPGNVATVLATLDAHPVLDTLHPGLRDRVKSAEGYIAVPYSVAWADDMLFVYDRLNAAAALVEEGDPAFARYLRLRGRDLLADNYDGGDAAWVTGRYTGRLNAQIGSYETYDDALYGVKTFFSMSLLRRDEARSAELARAIGDLQAIEEALPYDAHKRVRSDIPVGVYDVMADFGQARGTNTATILPNEGHLARQFGRTILIRANILTNDTLTTRTNAAFDAATVDAHHGEFTSEGNFYRTLWHEVGHYLGPDQTADGRDLDAALLDTADMFEEMKADLVSLFAAPLLRERGFHDEKRLRSIYAAGIRRVLQNNRPRREQPYQVMQLMQWNWFLDRGLLEFDGGRLRIQYQRYPEAVKSLLAAVLELQRKGDAAAANAFVERWAKWDESLHGEIARRIREASSSRYTLVRYEALGEAP